MMQIAIKDMNIYSIRITEIDIHNKNDEKYSKYKILLRKFDIPIDGFLSNPFIYGTIPDRIDVRYIYM